MSSHEIAELVDQRHDSVKRTIDTLVSKSVIVRPQFEDEQSADAMGRQLKAAEKDRSSNCRDATMNLRNRAINHVAQETNHDRRHTKIARPDQSSH